LPAFPDDAKVVAALDRVSHIYLSCAAALLPRCEPSQGETMSPKSLADRVLTLGQQMTGLRELPAQVAALTSQFVQLRTDMRGELSALRSELRAEIAAGDAALRAEMAAGNEETRRHMRVLHEDVISRLTVIQEALPRQTRRRKTR
jgi:hypothetical protein